MLESKRSRSEQACGIDSTNGKKGLIGSVAYSVLRDTKKQNAQDTIDLLEAFLATRTIAKAMAMATVKVRLGAIFARWLVLPSCRHTEQCE